MRIVAVSELTRYLKDLMSEDYVLQDVWVRGEITNYTQSAAGHRYFSLKDETASIRCVLFAPRGRSSQVIPPMRNGMAVLAHGRMSFYEQRGDLQLYVDAVEDAGIGILHLRFQALKDRLEAEGLFDVERKRPIPASPMTIGVVTSASAAALRDIVRTIRIRCPLARVVLAPALVQGDGAAEQVAAAIDLLNAHGEAEVILVARGGGSIEELWAFNEEVVARAILRSRVPVVTGVGHETDFTIADFVADLRASTPTAAATLVTADMQVWRDAVDQSRQRLQQAIEGYVDDQGNVLSTLLRRLERTHPQRRIDDARQTIDGLEHSLVRQFEHLLELRREHLRAHALQLHSLSPLATLGRGFAVVRREADGALVSSVTHVSPGQGLSVRVADGTFAATAGARMSEPADSLPGEARPRATGARTPRSAKARATIGTDVERIEAERLGGDVE